MRTCRPSHAETICARAYGAHVLEYSHYIWIGTSELGRCPAQRRESLTPCAKACDELDLLGSLQPLHC